MNISRFTLPRVLLLAGVLAAATACESTPRRHESGKPFAYSRATERPPGVLNTPNNTGNPPSDLDPHGIRWGDVRPPY